MPLLPGSREPGVQRAPPLPATRKRVHGPTEPSVAGCQPSTRTRAANEGAETCSSRERNLPAKSVALVTEGGARRRRSPLIWKLVRPASAVVRSRRGLWLLDRLPNAMGGPGEISAAGRSGVRRARPSAPSCAELAAAVLMGIGGSAESLAQPCDRA